MDAGEGEVDLDGTGERAAPGDAGLGGHFGQDGDAAALHDAGDTDGLFAGVDEDGGFFAAAPAADEVEVGGFLDAGGEEGEGWRAALAEEGFPGGARFVGSGLAVEHRGGGMDDDFAAAAQLVDEVRDLLQGQGLAAGDEEPGRVPDDGGGSGAHLTGGEV
jgi:hypothetical protein